MKKTISFYLTLILIQLFSIQLIGANLLNHTHTNIVFRDNANVREQPSAKSKVLGKLKHGTAVVECHEIQIKSDTIGGVDGYWRPIKYNSGIGYIWESVLADGYFRSIEFKEDVFMMKHNSKKEIEFKVFRKGNNIHHTTHKGVKGKSMIGSTPIGKTYFSQNKEIIAIAFAEPGHGLADSYLLFSWNGKEIEITNYKLNDESILGMYPKFEKGIINANLVNMREEPNANAIVLQTLNINTLVTLDSINFKMDTVINGLRKYWHKVKIGNKLGFVHSDFLDIPIRYIKSNIQENESFLYTNKSLVAFNWDKIVGRYKFKEEGSNYEYFYNFGSKGLNPNFRFLSLYHVSGECGGWNGHNYYLWDGKKFTSFGQEGHSGEISYFEYKSFVFPDDYGGVPNKIILEEAFIHNSNLGGDDLCKIEGIDFKEYLRSYTYEYKGDTLIEVPSKQYYLRELFSEKYPKYELTYCEFSDLNKDGIEDVVFFLQTKEFENRENMSPITGFALGDGKESYTDLICSKSIIKKWATGIDIKIEDGQITILAFYLKYDAENSNYNTTAEKYIFTYSNKEKNAFWHSKTRYMNKHYNYYLEDSEWIEEKTQYFKTQKIDFENAW